MITAYDGNLPLPVKFRKACLQFPGLCLLGQPDALREQGDQLVIDLVYRKSQRVKLTSMLTHIRLGSPIE
jgi:hypothetical protein